MKRSTRRVTSLLEERLGFEREEKKEEVDLGHGFGRGGQLTREASSVWS